MDCESSESCITKFEWENFAEKEDFNRGKYFVPIL